jgi:hypothetical protein
LTSVFRNSCSWFAFQYSKATSIRSGDSISRISLATGEVAKAAVSVILYVFDTDSTFFISKSDEKLKCVALNELDMVCDETGEFFQMELSDDISRVNSRY